MTSDCQREQEERGLDGEEERKQSGKQYKVVFSSPGPSLPPVSAVALLTTRTQLIDLCLSVRLAAAQCDENARRGTDAAHAVTGFDGEPCVHVLIERSQASTARVPSPEER